MKTETLDRITRAEANHVELEHGTVIAWRGRMANHLINSPDFGKSARESTACFQVWEVTEGSYDWRTDSEQRVCILRAQQQFLSSDTGTGALDYMANENRVLVHNRDVKEAHEEGDTPSVLFDKRRRIYDERGHT